MHSTLEAFRQAIVAAGLTPPGGVTADGKIHRFPTNGTADDDSGWYVLHPDGLAAGAFGDWRTGLRQQWSSKSERTMSPQERAGYAKRLESIKQQREAEDNQRHAEAAAKACRIWEVVGPAPDDHPYLTRKNVASHGLRLSRDGWLIVPLRDLNGAISSLEFIDAAGEKRFLPGGAKRERCFVFGDAKESDALLITEGWATGASVYEASGRATVVAFDAGNLLPVAKAIRLKWPDKKLLLCGDHDESGVGQTAAREAAQAVGGVVTIPERKGEDWNDVHIRCGLDAVKAEIEAVLGFVAASESDTSGETAPTSSAASVDAVPQLEDPEPIRLEQIALPPFPVDSLPVEWLGEMVEAVAAATETPRELACLMSLGVVATAVQRRYAIEPEPGYVEPLPLWMCCAMESGNRKTATLKALTRPLLAYERRETAQLAQLVKEAESARRLADDRIKVLRHKAAKAGGADREAIRAALLREEAELPTVPITPRLWCQDVTPEKLGALMAEHHGAMAAISDEGGIFDILAGRYSQGVPNLDLFLQAFSGSPYRVDRGSRPAVYLESPLLTIVLAPQPSILQGLAKHPGFRGRGLLARFFFALPTSTLGFRQLVARPIPEGVESRYDAGVSSLLAHPLPSGDLRRIRFDPGSEREWKSYQRYIETEMRPHEGAFANLRDWASKAPGGAARLAGVLHCARYTDDDPANHLVDLATTEAALKIVAVLERHALATFSLMAVSSDLDAAGRVWTWIEQGRHQTFSRRDLFNAVRAAFPTVEDLRPALAVLEERAYIFAVTEARRTGRPSPQFRVNSRLAEGWRP